MLTSVWKVSIVGAMEAAVIVGVTGPGNNANEAGRRSADDRKALDYPPW